MGKVFFGRKTAALLLILVMLVSSIPSASLSQSAENPTSTESATATPETEQPEPTAPSSDNALPTGEPTPEADLKSVIPSSEATPAQKADSTAPAETSAAPQIEFPDDVLAPTDEPIEAEANMELPMSLDAEPASSPTTDTHLPENLPCTAEPAEPPMLGASLHSHKNGSWTDPTVWGYKEGSGVYPQPQDVVLVSHRVGLDIKGDQNRTIAGLAVDGGGELYNSYFSQGLTINGPLVNHGTIAIPQYDQYGLSFSVSGDISNTGKWETSGLNLIGTGSRSITAAGNFTVKNDIGLAADLTLEGCTFLKARIDLNGHTLTVPEGSRLSVWQLSGGGTLAGEGMVHVRGNSTGQTDEVRGNIPYLVFAQNGDYGIYGKYSAEEIIFVGTGTRKVSFHLGLTGNVTVRPDVLIHGKTGVLHSYTNIDVSGDFRNQGVIEQYSGADSSDFNLLVGGDLINEGRLGGDGGGVFSASLYGNFYSPGGASYGTKTINANWPAIAGTKGYRVRFQDAASGAVQTVEAGSPKINLYSRRNGSYFWRVQPLYGENDERWAGDFSGIRTVNIRPEEVPAALLVVNPDEDELLPLMSYDFGGQETRTVGERIFQLKNFGNEDLAFHPENALSLEGPDAGDFRLGGFERDALAPNQSRSLALIFAPATEGLKSATLVIRSSDPFFPEFRIELRGSAHSDTATIHSTFTGGTWGTATTWLEGRAPTPTDIVKIFGPVTTTSQDPVVAGLLIAEGGSLSGGTIGYSVFTVNGIFRNEGRVANKIVNSQSSGVILDVYGDVINRGSLENSSLRIFGNADREISGTFPVSVTINGNFALLGDPVFTGSSFSMGKQAEMRLPPEGKVTVTGAGIGDVKLGGGQLFVSGSSQSVGDLTADTIILGGSGKKLIGEKRKFTGAVHILPGVIMQDTEGNPGGSRGDITIYGDIVNEGVITNGTKDIASMNQLLVTITGDIVNTGTWNNSDTRVTWLPVTGATEYEFEIAPFGQAYPEPTKSVLPQAISIKSKLTTAWHWRTRAQMADGSYTEWIERTINAPTNTAPTMSLNGDNPIELTEGDEFIDPGVAATDAEDEDIASRVHITYFRLDGELYIPVPALDTATAGTYQIFYALTDSGGLSAPSVSRTVIVYPKPTLAFPDPSKEPAFADPETNLPRGTDKVKATAGEEPVTFKVVYTDASEPEAVMIKLNVEEQLDFLNEREKDRLQYTYSNGQEPHLGQTSDQEGETLSLLGPGILNEQSVRISNFKPVKGFSLDIFTRGYGGSTIPVRLEAFNAAGNIIGLKEESLFILDGKHEAKQKISIQSNNNDITSIMLTVLGGNGCSLYLNKIGILAETPMWRAADQEENILYRDEKYINGESFVYVGPLPQGKYHYWFESTNGHTGARKPEHEKLTGPIIGIPGGKPDYLELETGYSNVVFLPGILASKLYLDDCSDNPVLLQNQCQIWPPTAWDDENDLAWLKMHDNGKDAIFTNIFTKDVIGEGFTYGPNIYYSLLQDMQKWKEEGEINAYMPLPYDWRFGYDELMTRGKEDNGRIKFDQNSVTDSPYLLTAVRQMAESAANGKVTIVAHSNGGLVAKKMMLELKKTGEEQLAENLILVASPQLGTPDAIGQLLHGAEVYTKDMFRNWQLKTFGEAWIGFDTVMEGVPMRDLVNNMPMVYNLLPSEKYFEKVFETANDIEEDDTGAIRFDGDFASHNPGHGWDKVMDYSGRIEKFGEFEKFILGNDGRTFDFDYTKNEFPITGLTTQFAEAKAQHALLDNWTPPASLNIIQIAGWGLDTIAGIRYFPKIDHFENSPDNSDPLNYKNIRPVYGLDYRPIWTFDGDGTVVVPSAIAMRGMGGVETYFMDLMTYNEFLRLNNDRKHSNMLEIDDVRLLISDYVNHTPVNESDFEYLFNNQPSPKKDEDEYIRLSLHSPVSIDLYDTEGNHTGLAFDPENPDAPVSIEENIPNSYYLEFGEGKYLGIPKDRIDRIELNGLDYGTFTFEMTEVLGDEELERKTFTDIPTSPDMKAELIFTSPEEPATLSIDADGDDETDVTLTGNETADEQENAVASLQILSSIIGNLDADPQLKQLLLKKLLLAEHLYIKGKMEKSIKILESVNTRLEKEIRRNARLQEKEAKKAAKQEKMQGKIDALKQEVEDDTIEATEDDKLMKELEKEAKKDARLQQRIQRLELRLLEWQQRWEAWKIKHTGERITTEDAERIILLLHGVIQKFRE